MKTYHPTTTSYRELLAACRRELSVLGYSTGMARLNGAGEFLQRMEGQGKTDIRTITTRDVRAHLAHLHERPGRRGPALSTHTVDGYVFSLRLLFDYCERHGLIEHGSPLAGVRLERGRRGRRRYCCSRTEITRLYAACPEDLRRRAVLHLLYGCGLRRSEAVSLNVGDVDGRAGLLYVRRGKGGKRRAVPLGAEVLRGLKDYLHHERPRWVTQQSGPAFLLNDRGDRMRGDTLARHVRALVVAAELEKRPITPHVLRHSIATHLLAGGMSVERVRDFLGHDCLETTQGYTRVKKVEP
jgi:integrase/recombinase XerD